MKADPVEVGIILDNRRRYNVPIYQRHYEWGRQKELPQFWNDVRTKAIEQLNGKSQRYYHYFGALVIEQKGVFSARQVQTYQVVDGQQRLTTFQVFLAAARDYALSVGMNDSAEAVLRYLKNNNPKQMQMI